ncbi:MAG: type IV toxin-antitoxin system AbiEi family antitoxin domain-containing protein [Anaerolineales bacterium]
MNTARDRALKTFREHHGLLRTAQAIKLGMAPRTLYALRDAGTVVEVSRGLYRLAELPPLSQPDLVTVASKIPRAVICLVSALDYHDLTTQIPHAVYIALPSEAERPRLSYPPLRLFWFSGQAYSAGIEEHELDGVPVKIYGPEKTLADCFKYRNKIGMEVALEALRRCRDSSRFNLQRLLHFARICRVEKLMRPYLEALA